MVDDVSRGGGLPTVEAVAMVTREDLNDSMFSLRTSMMTKVKSLFRELP